MSTKESIFLCKRLTIFTILIKKEAFIMNRTDLALEIVSEKTGSGVKIKKSRVNNLPLTEIELEENNAAAKPPGNYTTLHFPESLEHSKKAEADALFTALGRFIPRKGRVLVAGLGNENITPDSLGVRAVSRVAATAHFRDSEDFRDLGMREVYVVETGVLAQTGMESGEQLKFIADGIKPDLAVVVDSLACAETDRLGRTVQITDTGIAPGSGVGNSRREVSQKTLGVPVVAIGVPTVIDWQGTGNPAPKPFMVTPRDIDNVINHFAEIISKALNRVLLPTLTETEIERLRL